MPDGGHGRIGRLVDLHQRERRARHLFVGPPAGADERPREDAVLPAPRSPRKASTSPARTIAASLAAKAIVSASLHQEQSSTSSRSVLEPSGPAGPLCRLRRATAGCDHHRYDHRQRVTMTSDPLRADVAIIGAGPVGLFAIFECGMLRMGCHVFDALDAVGGQCSALYPEKPIFDVPGSPPHPCRRSGRKTLRTGGAVQARFPSRPAGDCRRRKQAAAGGWRATAATPWWRKR